MEKFLKEIKLGNITIPNNIFLAPMAGVTDVPFRYICNKYGGCVYSPTEMVSSKGLVYNDHKTHKIMDPYEGEFPHIVQIFGSDIDVLKKVVLKFNDDKSIDIIDFNLGCPAPKVTKNGDGSELLKDTKKIEKIVSSIMSVTKKPVTVKFRLGIDKNSIVGVEVAKICERNGVSMIVVHGRTKKQLYSGKADLDEIKKIKESVKIPVIGNGDVKDLVSVKEMFEKTGVDGIMIGRASLGNPWIFKSILSGKEYTPTLEERYNCIMEHLNLAVKREDERVAIPKFRKHIAWYLKGLKNSSYVRDRINHEVTYNGVVGLLNEYFDTLKKINKDT